MSFLFGGGDDGSKEAARARADEEARQARIRSGTARINSIFEGGGAKGVGAASGGYDPTKKYYTANGAVWTPKTGMSPATTTTSRVNTGIPTTGDHGAMANRTENRTVTTPGTAYADPKQQFIDAMKGGLFTGVKKDTGAFGGDFFANRRKAYMDYATPQLQKQYGDAQRQLTYALDRGGNLDSSAAAVQTGDLTSLYGTNKQAVADKAVGYENEARTAVEDARSDLVKTLNVTGDAEGAARGAINRASALSRPDPYSPLSQLFADFTATLGTQAAMERAEASSRKNYAKYDTGLFAPGRVSNA
jgi:hypothetical protein